MKTSFVIVLVVLLTMIPAAAQAATSSAPAEGSVKPGDIVTLRWSAISVYNPCADEAHQVFVEKFTRGEAVRIAPPHPSIGINHACGAYRIKSLKTGEISWIRGWLLKPT